MPENTTPALPLRGMSNPELIAAETAALDEQDEVRVAAVREEIARRNRVVRGRFGGRR